MRSGFKIRLLLLSEVFNRIIHDFMEMSDYVTIQCSGSAILIAAFLRIEIFWERNTRRFIYFRKRLICEMNKLLICTIEQIKTVS